MGSFSLRFTVFLIVLCSVLALFPVAAQEKSTAESIFINIDNDEDSDLISKFYLLRPSSDDRVFPVGFDSTVFLSSRDGTRSRIRLYTRGTARERHGRPRGRTPKPYVDVNLRESHHR